MVGRSAHDGQPGREVNAVATVESLERGKPLVVVHGQHAVERLITAMGEETVGGERAESVHALVGKLFYSRDYHLILFHAEQASVAGVRIEGEHGYARVGYAEVALQRLVENSGFLNNTLLGYGLGNVFYRQVGGNQRHTHNVVKKNHQRLAAFADALFVLQARAAAFPDSLEDDQLEALAKGTLRAHAATKPDTALGDLTALLAYAQGQRRAKAVKAIIRQANLSTRHLLKAKTYDAWRAAAENAETALDAAANLATLRERAKSGAPTANKALALALIKANRWDAATLEACTRSGDAALADPAKAETANDPIEAGNGWWDAADAQAKTDPALAKALRAHAAACYRKGLPALSGLRARLIQKRIDEAD